MIEQRMKGRITSVKYALKGWHHVFQELNFKIHIATAIIVLIASAYFKISPTEWSIIILLIAGVLSTEAINTSIESVCDRISPEKDEHIRIAKDVAAGAVLIWAFTAIIIGAIIFIPYAL